MEPDSCAIAMYGRKATKGNASRPIAPIARLAMRATCFAMTAVGNFT